jgi:hypothetical protein
MTYVASPLIVNSSCEELLFFGLHIVCANGNNVVKGLIFSKMFSKGFTSSSSSMISVLLSSLGVSFSFAILSLLLVSF